VVGAWKWEDICVELSVFLLSKWTNRERVASLGFYTKVAFACNRVP
jgi:hypothetical protein